MAKRKDDWRPGGYVQERESGNSREKKMGVTRGYEVVAGDPRGYNKLDANTARNYLRSGTERAKTQRKAKPRTQKRG